MMNSSKNAKRGLVFVTTAYLAFSAIFANVPFSRTLQQGEESALAPITSETDEKGPVDILVIVMGEAQTFPHWKRIIGSLDNSIEFLFGSFDKKLTADACNNEDDLDCQTAFIPGTTWTSGRNLLAEEALRKEMRREKKYDYWLFMDDDVHVDCIGGEPMEKLLGPGNCWQKVFNFISSDHVPEKATSVAIPYGGKGEFGFGGFSTTDAFFAAFKRDRLPYILPYPTLQEGFGEWVSQAALFCIMRTCHPSSAIVIPFVIGRNGAHRDYNRSINMAMIYQTIQDQYHDKEADFCPCQQLTVPQILQGYDRIGLYDTGEELNNAIPPADLDKCSPMNSRFNAWKSQIKF